MTNQAVDIGALPLAPKNPLPYLRQLKTVRTFHTGMEVLRDSGGPVTRLVLAPRWLMPELVAVNSPQGVHDVLSRSAAIVERTTVHHEMHQLMGPSLFVLGHQAWLPRKRALQPVFTKQHVRAFGTHIARAAETAAERWLTTSEVGLNVDLDTACRALTLSALGHSVLGTDLDEHAEAVCESMQITVRYTADRALSPVRAPRWLPTPARRRARAAAKVLRRLAEDVLVGCRADPTRDAPLVRALMAATDPDTGQALSDDEIRDELVTFMLAGHDTTATTLTYALWALGRHPELQDKVRAEVAELGDREITPTDLPHLAYTGQVLRESLRLCPPAAVIGRTAMEDIDVDGYRVAAGTMVTVGIYAMHRDPALWRSPVTFDPDRFSPENSSGRDRWQYVPFGAGPRSCIGDHFAMLEATLALATIVRRLEIRSIDPDFPMAVPFTTVAGAPIPARVREVREGRSTAKSETYESVTS